MFAKDRLEKVLINYKQDFVKEVWPKNKFKWEAIKVFQDNWDVNAVDFADMLRLSLQKIDNLFNSLNKYSLRVINEFAKAAPEEVRAMFKALYNEDADVYDRIAAFKAQASTIMPEKYGKKNEGKKSCFQDEHAISVYLWLRYPDKHYIYKYGVSKATAKELNRDYDFKQGAYENNIRNTIKLFDEVYAVMERDTELVKLFRSQLTDTCYQDPELKTLTHDICFYIFEHCSPKPKKSGGEKPVPSAEEASEVPKQAEAEPPQEEPQEVLEKGDEACGYWWLVANPKIWSFSEIAVGKSHYYTFYNEKGKERRIFQNFLDARPGDVVICYESNPVKQIVALAKVGAGQDGEKLYFEKTEGLLSPIDYQTLKACSELEKMEYFVNMRGSLFKLTKDEFDYIMDMIREENPLGPAKAIAPYTEEDFLEEVYMSKERYNRLVAVLKNKKNVILQGAPGVGKTFAAKRLAYSMMGGRDDSRIELVQFHQNYSYEDFMMGYRPVEDGFELKDGIFYRFCKKAANQPDKPFFFIIDEINRGNMSKIFGELLMLIEKDYRGENITLAYNGLSFAVPENIHIIGLMNTADRSLAMIDYALRRRFSFVEMEPGFDSDGFKKYQNKLDNETLNKLVEVVKELNEEIASDKALGRGFCIGHSYFCGAGTCTDDWLHSIVDFDLLPMLSEYWFDDTAKLQIWEGKLHGVFK